MSAVIYGGYNEPVAMKLDETIEPGDIVLYSDEGWIKATTEDRFKFSSEDSDTLPIDLQSIGLSNGHSDLLSSPRVNDDVSKQGGKLNIVKFAGDGFEVKGFSQVSGTLVKGDKLVLDGGSLVAFDASEHCATTGDSAVLLGEVTVGNDSVSGDPVDIRTDGYPQIVSANVEA